MKKFTIVAVFLISICCRCSTSVSGGTSDTSNIRFAAVMHESDGRFAAGASVRLRSSDYLSATNGISLLVSATSRETVTNDSGYFCLDNLAAGSYSIEINNRTTAASLLRFVIDSDKETVTSAKDTLSDTLKPYALVNGHVEINKGDNSQYYCQIYGLERTVEIDSSGNFAFTDLPQGEYRVRIVSLDTVLTPSTEHTISVSSGTTTEIPFASWRFSKRCVLNTSETGANVCGTVTGFPVLVRLDSSNFDFSTAASNGSDIRFTSPEGKELPCEIERWDSDAESAQLWVAVDTVNGNDNSQYILMFWGNAQVSDGVMSSAVFDTSRGFQGTWHMSDLTSGTAGDATGNRQSGSLTNVASVAGIAGFAGSFDGASSYISLDSTTDGALDFAANSDFTISAWVCADSFPYDQFIIGKGNYQYHIKIKESQWFFACFAADSTDGWQRTNYPVTAKTWQHVTGVRQGEKQYLYVDGTCVDSTIDFLASDSLVTAIVSDVEFGRKNDPQSNEYQYFNGKIDEICFSNKSRNADWIMLSFMNQKSDGKLVEIK